MVASHGCTLATKSLLGGLSVKPGNSGGCRIYHHPLLQPCCGLLGSWSISKSTPVEISPKKNPTVLLRIFTRLPLMIYTKKAPHFTGHCGLCFFPSFGQGSSMPPIALFPTVHGNAHRPCPAPGVRSRRLAVGRWEGGKVWYKRSLGKIDK